jgi:hypothetical protein
MKSLLLLIVLHLLILSYGISHAQWKQTLSPVVGSVHCLAVKGTNIFAGADSGIYISTDKGVNWAQSNTGLPANTVYSFAFNGSNIFTGHIGVSLSTNNGANWTQAGLSMTPVFSLASKENNIFAGTGGGVYLSTNNGINWTEVNNGLNNSMDVHALIVNGAYVFAGTTGYGVFLTTNNGSNWTQVNNGLTDTFVHALTVSGTNLFAGTDNGAFLSTNNGTNWTQVKNNIMVFSLTVSGDTVFAGTYGGGVFRSTDNGINWLLVNNGLTSASVYSLALLGTNIYAGTDGAGVWKCPISGLSGASSEVNVLPDDFTLFQNYPNPFNPGTIISYSLPSASIVKIIVYNTLGQKVKLLENSFKQPGNYSVTFNASDLPGGIYFYKLDAGQFSQSKKMMLIK